MLCRGLRPATELGRQYQLRWALPIAAVKQQIFRLRLVSLGLYSCRRISHYMPLAYRIGVIAKIAPERARKGRIGVLAKIALRLPLRGQIAPEGGGSKRQRRYHTRCRRHQGSKIIVALICPLRGQSQILRNFYI
jgi:hypothetical protein